MQPNKDFNLIGGLKIGEIRETFQMTQADFSEKCDISESFLAAVKGDWKGVTSKTLYKICTSMNVSADYLIRGRDAGFETDAALKLLCSMDKHSRKGALRILYEYANALCQIQQKFTKE